MTNRRHPKARKFVPQNIRLFNKTASRWTLRTPKSTNFYPKPPIMHHRGEQTNCLQRDLHEFLTPKHATVHQKRNGWTVGTQMRVRLYPTLAIYQPKGELLEPAIYPQKGVN